MDLAVSGHCLHCSWQDRKIFHGTPWCPRVPALGWVDWNAAGRLAAQANMNRRTHYIMARTLTRPAGLGETILIYSDDGAGMATWARVIEVHADGAVGVVEIGYEGPDPCIAYAD